MEVNFEKEPFNSLLEFNEFIKDNELSFSLSKEFLFGKELYVSITTGSDTYMNICLWKKILNDRSALTYVPEHGVTLRGKSILYVLTLLKKVTSYRKAKRLFKMLCEAENSNNIESILNF